MTGTRYECNLGKKATKYDCNYDHNGDQIRLKSEFQNGPNIIAIPVFKRTIYDCNLFQYGPNTTGILKIVLYPRDYYFWTNLAKRNIQ